MAKGFCDQYFDFALESTTGFFLDVRKKTQGEKNSKLKEKTQASSPKSRHFLKTFGPAFVKNLQVL